MQTSRKYTAIVASSSGDTIAQIKEAIGRMGMFESCKGAFSIQEVMDMSKKTARCAFNFSNIQGL